MKLPPKQHLRIVMRLAEPHVAALMNETADSAGLVAVIQAHASLDRVTARRADPLTREELLDRIGVNPVLTPLVRALSASATAVPLIGPERDQDLLADVAGSTHASDAVSQV
jgi:hypothetical protein